MAMKNYLVCISEATEDRDAKKAVVRTDYIQHT